MAESQFLKQYGPFDKEIAIFAAMLRVKMEKNAHRGRWEQADLSKLLDHLDKETDELRAAIAEGKLPEIMMEAADVGNLAMIIMFACMENPSEQSKRAAAVAASKRRGDRSGQEKGILQSCDAPRLKG